MIIKSIILSPAVRIGRSQTLNNKRANLQQTTRVSPNRQEQGYDENGSKYHVNISFFDSE